MRAVTISKFGAPEVLTLGEIPDPTPRPHHLLVQVRAFGINRADALQRAGNYPPPPGESDIPGLELAGEVVSCGSAVTDFAPGDRVFGLVGSGAYAEQALLDHRLAVTVVLHGFPRFDNTTHQGVVRHKFTRPERGAQFFFGDDTIAVSNQVGEDIEHLGLDFNDMIRMAQLIELFVEFVIVELIDHDTAPTALILKFSNQTSYLHVASSPFNVKESKFGARFSYQRGHSY